MAAGGGFAREIDMMRQRVAAFERHGRAFSGPEYPPIAEATEVLCDALEELRAANEELRQQNEELTVANQRYQELFYLAPDAYLMTDIHGTIQEANDAAADLLKIRVDFLVGKPLSVSIVEEPRTFLTQLTALRQQKEILLKEVYHRVKNNLQIISSLLSLQSSDISDPKIRDMFTESQRRTQSMASVHEILDQSRDFGKIDMVAYLGTTAAHLLRSYQTADEQVSVMVDADQVFLEADTAIPCALLLTELMSNCLKHAFPDGRKGRVYLGLRSNPAGQVTLVVRDDGVGFPAGVDFRHPETLGLQLVSALTEQRHGTLTMMNDRGCEIEVIFPG